MEKEFEMTQEDMDNILNASKPVRYMMSSNGTPPPSPQVRANQAWENLGKKMGFNYLTVRPIPGKDNKHFIACDT